MKKYRSLGNLKKRCACGRRSWERCSHPWFFTFQWKGHVERGSLKTSTKEDALKRFTEIKGQMMNGIFVNAKPEPVPVPNDHRPTFAMVADAFAKDPEGLVKQSIKSQQGHKYDVAFLATVTVLPGVPFTEKPFADIVRGDIKQAITAKTMPREQTYKSKRGTTFTKTVGGRIAANRLYQRLQAIWSWALEEGYVTTSPFIRIRKGKNRLKHDEFGRDRRLRDGEEAGLLAGANQHLKDLIVAALETGCRKGELLGLQWKQVRWLQNEIHLPAPKTKTRKDRRIPISPSLREILTRRQYGMTEGPNPQQFKFGPEHHVFGDSAGGKILDIKTAWENAVLKAHDIKPQRTATGGLSAERQAKLAEIDLHFHDLRHEAGSRKLEAGWPLHAVSAFLGHANVTTTARYLNVKDDYLQELINRKPLALVQK